MLSSAQKEEPALFRLPPRSAHASATLFSLIETAKADGLEPYRYLRYLFTKLPLVQAEEEYRTLIPGRLDREDFSRFSSYESLLLNPCFGRGV